MGFLTPVRGSFRAIARAVVPASAGLDEAAWIRAEDIVDEALADRPAGVRRQVVLFVRVLNLLSGLRFGRRLERLDAARTQSLLAALERSPLLLLRRGVWGIRTLAFMGYYGRDEARRSIGYAARPGGWEARGATQGPWPQRAGAAPAEPGVMTADPEGDAHA